MSEWMAYDERTRAAEQLVEKMNVGTKVYLRCEPDNIADPNAVAIYHDWRKIGYVAVGDLQMVRPSVEHAVWKEACISRKDKHVTLFAEVDTESDGTGMGDAQSHLAVCPLDRRVYLTHTDDERRLELLAPGILASCVTGENVGGWLTMVEEYVSLTNLSLCMEDTRWARCMERKLMDVWEMRAELALSAADAERLEALRVRMYESIGDFTREGGHQNVLERHIDRLRRMAEEKGNLFDKFDRIYLGRKPRKADQRRVRAEWSRLTEWLNSIGIAPLGENPDLRALGSRLCYDGYSRADIYIIISVLLIVERLEEYVENEDENESILPASLATEEAMEMWAKLRKRDLIDEDYQPTMSQKRAAILASVMSDILQLSPRWAAFEQLWGITDLSTKLSQAQNTQYYPQVLQQIEKVLI